MNDKADKSLLSNAAYETAIEQGCASLTSEIAVIDEETIRNKIYEIRGQRVMLDFELAEIYGYETKNFNRQVKNNAERFEGDEFMFQLTSEEFQEVLRCKNFTSRWGGSRYLPHAFTEQGVYLLMTVLRGDLAVRQSRALVMAFKAMKDYVVNTQGLATQRDLLRLSMLTAKNTDAIQDVRALFGEQSELFAKQQQLLMEHDDKLSRAFEQISETVKRSEISPVLLQFQPEDQAEILILDGQAVTADVTYIDIYSQAKESVYIIDDYINVKTLRLLQDVRPGVEVIVFSDNRHDYLRESDYRDFQTEFPAIPITFTTTAGSVHDRYIILDCEAPEERIFLCGASSKDAGVSKMCTIIEMRSGGMKDALHAVIGRLKRNPPLVLR